MTAATQNMLMQAIFNAKLPNEGPKVLPWNPDFATSGEVTVDLSYAITSTKQMSFVQCAYVDNSGNVNPISIQDQATNQIVTVPGGYQAIVPLLSPNPPRYTATTVTPGPVVPIFFLNIPLPPQQWPAAGAVFSFTAGGDLEVSDSNLLALTTPLADAMAVPSALNVGAAGLNWNGTNWDLNYNNHTHIIRALASGGVGTTTVNVTNRNMVGMSIFVHVTVVGGGGSVVVKLQAQDPSVAGTWFDIPGATTAAIAAPGDALLQIHPALTPVANQAVSALIPRNLRVSSTVAGAACTFSVAIAENL